MRVGSCVGGVGGGSAVTAGVELWGRGVVLEGVVLEDVEAGGEALGGQIGGGEDWEGLVGVAPGLGKGGCETAGCAGGGEAAGVDGAVELVETVVAVGGGCVGEGGGGRGLEGGLGHYFVVVV